MISTYLQWIESEIGKQSFGDQPSELYEPLRYIMQLGGKRLRPLLTLLSYSLFQDDVQKIVPLAAAVETFHNFTLLHDDIMDNAPLRRGKATVHRKWNTSTAILSGDVMQIKVYEMLLGTDDSRLREVLTAFNRCATEVCEGQQYDMVFEAKTNVSETQYLDMIRLKTAALLGFSLKLGGILAGASLADKEALHEFGLSIGTGFQLRDDFLDVYADKKKFGKRVGGDIIANKKTFLSITALAKAKGIQRKELMRWFSNGKSDSSKKIKAVTALYNALDIPILTEKKIAYCFRHGLNALNRVSASSDKKAALRDFTIALIERQA
jgi:geranylgeranyl diphosphate synthase type II